MEHDSADHLVSAARWRIRLAVALIVAVIAGGVGWSAPAGAAAIIGQWPAVAATIDCATLQSGYYHSMRVTATVPGLPAATQFDAKLFNRSSTMLGASTPITTDAQGTVTIDLTVSGNVVSGDSYNATLWSGSTLVARQIVMANTCASGVTPTGTLSADDVCPSRYLGTYGSIENSAYHLHGTLTGFVPGETYTLRAHYAAGSPSATADQGGAVAFDLVINAPLVWASIGIDTTSQTQDVGYASWTLAHPCPQMKTSFPARPTESDVNDDGRTDLLAIDLSGRLLYYQNGSAQNAGGLPFTTGRTIGSGWGPQFGIRIESTGDLTGDGYSELVAIRSDGALVAYYNNINSNPGRLPYSSGTTIGSGWQSFIGFTLGDVNGDGYADLIAERADHTYWLYMNHYPGNPGHLPFTSGVRMASPGYESVYGLAAVDLNSDGYADLWSYVGWMTPNLLPAGNTQPYGDFVSVVGNSGTLGGISMRTPQAGWAVGHYLNGELAAGVLIADPDGDGTLVYYDDLSGTGGTLPKVIGSGWTSIRQIIS